MPRRKLPKLHVEYVPIDTLKDHPRNYREHPDDQLEQIAQSLRENGFYRNVVVARDGTILAGHGVVKAARKLRYREVPVIRLPVDPDDPHALKVLAGDNELGHLAEQNDRLLTELLKEIKENDASGLAGTGFDEMMLASLVFVTRPASEIGGKHDAAQWVGLPGYEGGEEHPKVVVHFQTMEDKLRFGQVIGQSFTEKTDTVWWPPKDQLDAVSVKFE